MGTRAVFTPYAAEFPAANFPALSLVNRRPALAFDAAANETCQWTGVAPQGLTGTLTALIYYIMASATSGDTDWDVALEAVTSGDTTDLDAGDSFDTINSQDNTTVPAVAGRLGVISVTLTNADSIAAGDYFRLQLTRDAANDTAAGDAYVLGVELRDAA
jgi:hypothetical protein